MKSRNELAKLVEEKMKGVGSEKFVAVDRVGEVTKLLFEEMGKVDETTLEKNMKAVAEEIKNSPHPIQVAVRIALEKLKQSPDQS